MKFIVFEGIDRCGKTTQLILLKEWLEKKGYKVKATEEPSDTIIGDLVKASAKIEKRFCPEADALLFAADRNEHVRLIIKPALEKNNIVLSERYVYSSYAYQSVEGCDAEWIRKINRFIIKPDLVIVLDIPAEESRKRKREMLFDQTALEWKFEKLEFLKGVRKKYLELAEKNSNLIVIDGTKSIEDLHAKIKNIVEELLKF